MSSSPTSPMRNRTSENQRSLKKENMTKIKRPTPKQMATALAVHKAFKTEETKLEEATIQAKTYLAVGNTVYGYGNTAAESLKNVKKMDRKQNRFLVYESEDGNIGIDGIGYVSWVQSKPTRKVWFENGKQIGEWEVL